MARHVVQTAQADGIVMLFVGEGWGKSAAAFGYATRSAGRGWRTVVVQFLKGSTWNAAEIVSAGKLGIEWSTVTTDTTWGHGNPSELGARAWERSREAIEEGGYGLVVLDELTHALAFGWVDESQVLESLAQRQQQTSVIITGRSASPPIRSAADTITEFGLAKHHDKRGILA